MNISAQTVPNKKIIVHSWDLRVSLDDIVRNLDKIEKTPIDGISIFFQVKRSKPPHPYFGSIMIDSKWDKSWFTKELAGIKKISSGKLKHNFIFTKLTSRKRLSWNDDASWENCAHNFGIMAWLAKQAGAKGLIIDPEDYNHKKQYTYFPKDGTYAETAKLARKRGGQIMKAIATEYPEAVLLFFWLLSIQPELYSCDKISKSNLERTGSLWPHFVDGMLDKLPSRMRIVDATENAYRYNAEYMEFYTSAVNITRKAVYLISPENQDKYRKQVQIGFGIYLDSYTTKNTKSPWYLPPLKGSRLKRFELNFKQAMQVADEYCWLCGENGRLINWDSKTKKSKWDYSKGKSIKTWNQYLPGFNKKLAYIKNPDLYIDKIKKLIKSKTNLIKNADCKKISSKNKSLPASWKFWQKKSSKGTFDIDKTQGSNDSFSVKGTGITNGCFIVRTPVETGKSYAVEAFCKGKGKTVVQIRWKKNNKWAQENSDKSIYFINNGNSKWQHAFGIVDVPAGVDTLVVLLSVKQNGKQTIWFDNPAVYEL